ncbi:peroxisomal targeting signal receptor [Grosmannia clavigera kw1407]|uniref:Peroxisomal targeting signal receptor n=1 Tax=Grosmannia clavigera (strain kw1407 / UAMH 11150) TaxID=655863 RepID=F0XRP3_GROCL|nr:peroxisomal targeting signal receptor [Grosmannia clavigera kw1407]EFW99493.1 peroxisomal targeting signal receptor [Grosmannia clavigera kw1407]
MSFLGGAECSTAGNPLSQFTKHVQDDRSLQRDRLVNGGQNGSLSGFRSAGPNMAQDEMVNGFLQQGPNMPEMNMEPGHPSLSHQLAMDPARGVHLRAQSGSPAWADNFHAPAPMNAAFSPDDFANFQQQQQQQNMLHQQSQQPMAPSPLTAAGPSHAPAAMGMNGMAMGPGPMNMGMNSMPYMMYRQNMQANWTQPQFRPPSTFQQEGQRAAEGKGKGKVVELDDHQWEEQFARMEMHDQGAAEESVQKGKTEEAQAEAAIERELNQMDEKLLQPETDFGDLEAVWNGIQTEKSAMRSAFGEEDWKDVSETYKNWNSEWEPLNYRMGMDPRIDPYQFEEDNLFQAQNNPFEEGVRIMNENGNLSLAALAFEAACAREPGRVEAWVYLGSAQAQNEKETAAIRALEQALKLDPTNLSALMALAVSYTNEGYDTTAYRTLERWLSAKYPQVLPPAELSSAADVGFTDRQQLHDGITERFIQAAQLSPDGEHMDPDVQVGLGVLFYGAEDFDKAVDCFHASLASSEQGSSNQRSQVHLLWNRLGATLANSGRSEEAIAAYEKALSQHPNFVRARYNLGVSCINMGCYEEAASHLLAALAMHKEVEKSGREQAREILGGAAGGVTDEQVDRMTTQNRSTTLYDTLRRVFGLMDRRDLADRVAADMDPDSFRNEFDF